MKAPAVPLGVAFVAGVVAPRPRTDALVATLALVALIAIVGGVACAVRSYLRAGTVIVLAGFASLGSLAGEIHDRTVDGSALGRGYQRLGERVFSSPRLVTGRLRREPEPGPDVSLLVIDVETVVIARRELPMAGGVRASVRGRRRAHVDTLMAGDRISFWAVLREPTFFDNPGSFDGVSYLGRHHLDLFASIKSGLLVKRLEPANTPAGWLSRLRRWTLKRLDGALSSKDAFGVVAALVTGERAALSPELERHYQRAGVFHVMAISGAHVAIWIVCLHAFMRWCGLSTRITLLLLLMFLPIYAGFCGGRAPVVRAVVMASVVIAARLASVTVPAMQALFTAAVLLLVWEPASVGDAGFQLTMAALASILMFYEDIAGRLAFLGFVSRPLAVSIAAQLGVIPIAAWHFHRVNPGAPVTSLAAIPVAAAICVLGVVLVVVAGIPVLSTLVAASTRLMASVLNGIAGVAAELPAASIRVAAPGWISLMLYVAALTALKSTRRRVRAAGVSALCVLAAATVLPSRSPSGVLGVTALDVGHGDAIVLSLPEGGHVLVDGGGLASSTIDVGESVVLPYLLDRGVRRLDAVVVTHADYDHIGGLFTLLDELRVAAIWEGTSDLERPAYRALRSRAEARGIPVRKLRSGEDVVLGGVRFHVLAAGETDTVNANDRSVVLRVSYRDRHVLLTGDAERALEARLVRSGVDLRADVLKVAHHGSRSSTTEAFLDAVRPSFAIISARRHPSRAIPSAVVLHRLRARGIEYARTDLNGAVTVHIHDDGRMELSTYRQERALSRR